MRHWLTVTFPANTGRVSAPTIWSSGWTVRSAAGPRGTFPDESSAHAGLCEASPCGGHPVGQQEAHEYEAFGGLFRRRLYCFIRSRSANTFMHKSWRSPKGISPLDLVLFLASHSPFSPDTACAWAARSESFLRHNSAPSMIDSLFFHCFSQREHINFPRADNRHSFEISNNILMIPTYPVGLSTFSIYLLRYISRVYKHFFQDLKVCTSISK